MDNNRDGIIQFDNVVKYFYSCDIRNGKTHKSGIIIAYNDDTGRSNSPLVNEISCWWLWSALVIYNTHFQLYLYNLLWNFRL